MESEKPEYPRAVSYLVEGLQTIEAVDEAIEQTQSDLKTAENENDPIHQNRIPDLQEMLAALKQRKEELEHQKAA